MCGTDDLSHLGGVPESAEAPPTGGTHHTLNVHGNNYGQAAAGESVAQNQTVSVGPGDLSDLIANVREAMGGLPENDVSGAEAYLTTIDATPRPRSPTVGCWRLPDVDLSQIGDRATTALTGETIRTLWAYLVDRFGLPAGQ